MAGKDLLLPKPGDTIGSSRERRKQNTQGTSVARRAGGWGGGGKEERRGGVRVLEGWLGVGSHTSSVVPWGYFLGKARQCPCSGTAPLLASVPSHHPGSNLPSSLPISPSLSWGDEHMPPHPGQLTSSGLPRTWPWRDSRRIHTGFGTPMESLPLSVLLGIH